MFVAATSSGSTCRAIAAAGLALMSAIAPARAANTGTEPNRAFFGDLHLHTAYSFDAFVFKTTATPDDAYKFAKGAPLRHPAGGIYQLKHPMDFLAVTDHSESMGVFNAMADPRSPLSRLPVAKRLTDPDIKVRLAAYVDLIRASLRGDHSALGDPKDSQNVVADAWAKTIEAANENYEPGKFTTFIGYEWTAAPDGKNLHRNVIFRGDFAPQPFTAYDSKRPEDLWAFLEVQRRKGIVAVAIPHNPNVSDGIMFGTSDFNGKPITADYARRRAFFEREVEIIQIKGQSETTPILSPNDEFSDFEIFDEYLGQANKKITHFAGGYVRDALRTGLMLYEQEGVNPYKFGFVGDSDSHTGMSPIEENNYSGGHGMVDGTAETRLDCTYCNGEDYRKFGSAGLTGVWARENDREQIFDSLVRRETFATSGPRIQVRFFAGYGLAGIAPGERGWVDAAYRGGVPMGGELQPAPGQRPSFLVWAIKDPDSGNLDRIQIVKVWTTDGQSFEKVYDVAWSGARKIDPRTGKLPAVGNSVDIAHATYGNTIGATRLAARWQDPDFDPAVNAAYYARVIEIPTPRWSTYDAARLKRPIPDGLPPTIQERAYTSPIWYDVPPRP